MWKDVAEHVLHLFNWKRQPKQYNLIKNSRELHMFQPRQSPVSILDKEPGYSPPSSKLLQICETPGCKETVCESIVFISHQTINMIIMLFILIWTWLLDIYAKREAFTLKRWYGFRMVVLHNVSPLAQWPINVAFSTRDYNFPVCHNYFMDPAMGKVHLMKSPLW